MLVTTKNQLHKIVAKWQISSSVNGNKSMHQVQSMSTRDPTLIQFRHVSCVCVNCANKNSNTECELATHMPNWTLARLEPNDCLS